MLLKEEINKYLNYCKFQKELDDKTIKAYRADLEQFITCLLYTSYSISRGQTVHRQPQESSLNWMKIRF